MQATINSVNKFKITDLLLSEVLFIANMIPEIGSSQIIHGQIQIKLVLKRAVHIDEKIVIQGAQNDSFV
jgi:glycerol kinase